MALLCGGWFTTDSGQSLPKQNFLKGEDQMSSLDIVDNVDIIDIVDILCVSRRVLQVLREDDGGSELGQDEHAGHGQHQGILLHGRHRQRDLRFRR